MLQFGEVPASVGLHGGFDAGLHLHRPAVRHPPGEEAEGRGGDLLARRTRQPLAGHDSGCDLAGGEVHAHLDGAAGDEPSGLQGCLTPGAHLLLQCRAAAQQLLERTHRDRGDRVGQQVLEELAAGRALAVQGGADQGRSAGLEDQLAGGEDHPGRPGLADQVGGDGDPAGRVQAAQRRHPRPDDLAGEQHQADLQHDGADQRGELLVRDRLLRPADQLAEALGGGGHVVRGRVHARRHGLLVEDLVAQRAQPAADPLQRGPRGDLGGGVVELLQAAGGVPDLQPRGLLLAELLGLGRLVEVVHDQDELGQPGAQREGVRVHAELVEVAGGDRQAAGGAGSLFGGAGGKARDGLQVLVRLPGRPHAGLARSGAGGLLAGYAADRRVEALLGQGERQVGVHAGGGGQGGRQRPGQVGDAQRRAVGDQHPDLRHHRPGEVALAELVGLERVQLPDQRPHRLGDQRHRPFLGEQQRAPAGGRGGIGRQFLAAALDEGDRALQLRAGGAPGGQLPLQVGELDAQQFHGFGDLGLAAARPAAGLGEGDLVGEAALAELVDVLDAGVAGAQQVGHHGHPEVRRAGVRPDPEQQFGVEVVGRDPAALDQHVRHVVRGGIDRRPDPDPVPDGAVLLAEPAELQRARPAYRSFAVDVVLAGVALGGPQLTGHGERRQHNVVQRQAGHDHRVGELFAGLVAELEQGQEASAHPLQRIQDLRVQRARDGAADRGLPGVRAARAVEVVPAAGALVAGEVQRGELPLQLGSGLSDGVGRRWRRAGVEPVVRRRLLGRQAAGGVDQLGEVEAGHQLAQRVGGDALVRVEVGAELAGERRPRLGVRQPGQPGVRVGQLDGREQAFDRVQDGLAVQMGVAGGGDLVRVVDLVRRGAHERDPGGVAGLLHDVGGLVGHQADVGGALAGPEHDFAAQREGPGAHRGGGVGRGRSGVDAHGAQVAADGALELRPDRRRHGLAAGQPAADGRGEPARHGRRPAAGGRGGLPGRRGPAGARRDGGRLALGGLARRGHPDAGPGQRGDRPPIAEAAGHRRPGQVPGRGRRPARTQARRSRRGLGDSRGGGGSCRRRDVLPHGSTLGTLGMARQAHRGSLSGAAVLWRRPGRRRIAR